MTDDDRAYGLAAFEGMIGRTLDSYTRQLVAWAGPGRVRAACTRLLAGTSADAHAAIWKYRAEMLAVPLRPATINLRIAALRTLVRRAHERGACSWVLAVPGLKRPGARHYGITRSDVLALLLDAAHTAAPLDLRDLAAIWLTLPLGLRGFELVGLDVEHVDLARRTLMIEEKGSNGERRALALPGPTVDALRAWLEARALVVEQLGASDDDARRALLLSFDLQSRGAGRLTDRGWRDALARRSERVTGRTIAPHGLRHVSITTPLQLGRSVRDVQKFGRHDDVRTTIGYDDSINDPSGDIAAQIAAYFSLPARVGPGPRGPVLDGEIIEPPQLPPART